MNIQPCCGSVRGCAHTRDTMRPTVREERIRHYAREAAQAADKAAQLRARMRELGESADAYEREAYACIAELRLLKIDEPARSVSDIRLSLDVQAPVQG